MNRQLRCHSGRMIEGLVLPPRGLTEAGAVRVAAREAWKNVAMNTNCSALAYQAAELWGALLDAPDHALHLDTPCLCDSCEGTGEMMIMRCYGGSPVEEWSVCEDCDGTGFLS